MFPFLPEAKRRYCIRNAARYCIRNAARYCIRNAARCCIRNAARCCIRNAARCCIRNAARSLVESVVFPWDFLGYVNWAAPGLNQTIPGIVLSLQRQLFVYLKIIISVDAIDSKSGTWTWEQPLTPLFAW